MKSSSDLESTPGATQKARSCWNSIGVWGTQDCSELTLHSHCRNCPQYSSAAAELLGRPTPENYSDTWTEWMQQLRRPERKQSREESLLVFRVQEEWLAIPTHRLLEVIGRRSVHSVPNSTCPFLKGIANIRGQLLICLSLTKLLRLADRTAAQKSQHTAFERMVVLEFDTGPIVFPVSEVFGLVDADLKHLEPPPVTLGLARTRLTLGLVRMKIKRRLHRQFCEEKITVALLNADLLIQTVTEELV